MAKLPLVSLSLDGRLTHPLLPALIGFQRKLNPILIAGGILEPRLMSY